MVAACGARPARRCAREVRKRAAYIAQSSNQGNRQRTAENDKDRPIADNVQMMVWNGGEVGAEIGPRVHTHPQA